MGDAERDPLAGLPPDLARVLRDQSIIVPQDYALFDLLSKWQNAPSDTASADPLPDTKGVVTMEDTMTPSGASREEQ